MTIIGLEFSSVVVVDVSVTETPPTAPLPPEFDVMVGVVSVVHSVDVGVSGLLVD